MDKHEANIDLFALQRSTEMSPREHLDWLAAAWEFTMQIGRSREKQGKKWLPDMAPSRTDDSV